MAAASARNVREAVRGLPLLAETDLRQLWLLLRDESAEVVRDALMDVLPLLADRYGTAASALAADWYDDLREVAGVSGLYQAEPAPLPGSARYEALARWGVGPLFTAEPDQAATIARISGGLQRVIANAHRQTVVGATQTDNQARGWMRVGQGDSCGFCRMLIARGGRYTGAGVTFKAHDNCDCIAAPTWAPTKTVDTVAFQASQRQQTAAEKARTKAYISQHFPDVA